MIPQMLFENRCGATNTVVSWMVFNFERSTPALYKSHPQQNPKPSNTVLPSRLQAKFKLNIVALTMASRLDRLRLNGGSRSDLCVEGYALKEACSHPARPAHHEVQQGNSWNGPTPTNVVASTH